MRYVLFIDTSGVVRHNYTIYVYSSVAFRHQFMYENINKHGERCQRIIIIKIFSHTQVKKKKKRSG